MKITLLAGGVGGARFALGLRDAAREIDGAQIRIVANTGDDLWLAGVRICPDLDSLLYALAGVSDSERGWGRRGESERVAGELAAFGVGWPWFTLGDLDLGTHLARTELLRVGHSLTQATARLAERWPIDVTLLPATDAEVPTIVETDDGPMHFEEWWVRTRASVTPRAFVQEGVAAARVTDEASSAIAEADVVLLAPSNPVVSIGTILGIPGTREALAATAAPIVGVSPIIGGSAVRGMAATCLDAIGVEVSAEAVGLHYGARSRGGLLDGWLVDPVDEDALRALAAAGIAARAVPLWLHAGAPAASVAREALALARELPRA